MKKYVFLLLVFVATLTSCTNDEINIRNAVNFKINPSTVIMPFTWEWNPGDLESFDTNYQLRVRLLVYGSDGFLVAEDVQYFSNYSVVMNSSISLIDDDYTAVVITDLVGKAAAQVSEFWMLSDYKKLADTYIQDEGYIGGKNKILGISKLDFSVDGQKGEDVKINVQPAGTLFFVMYKNIHQYSDVTRLSLITSKNTERCIFNMDGSFSIESENNNGSFDWYIDYIDIEDYKNYQNIYGYYYVLPTSKMNLKFQYETTDYNGDLSNVMSINPEAGEEYAFILDLCDEDNDEKITYEYGIVNSNTRGNLNITRGNSENSDLKLSDAQTIYLKNIK